MSTSHYFYFFKHAIRTRLFNQKIPLLAGYKITHRCNLRCRGCPFWKMKTTDPAYSEAVQTLDSFYQAGVRLLIFEGGEPFLWRDHSYRLEDLIQVAKQRFFCVGITTNGTLPIETSADTVWVSLDGLAETHNLNRGDCFDQVIKNIEDTTHPNVMANLTINCLNHLEIPELVRFLASRVKGITIQFYYPFPDSEDLWLPKAERITVLDQLIRLKKNGYPILDTKSTLEALKENTWKCHPWLLASAEPDGRISYGCYLKNRAEVACGKCGFAAHVELSKAYDWHPGAVFIGHRIFRFKVW